MATPRLLNTDAKNWSVDRGRDPSIHKRWHLTFHLEAGALRPPVVTFAERIGSQLGVGLSPKLSPLSSILCRNAPPVHRGSRFRIQAPVRWVLSESSNDAMVSLIFLSPVNKVPDIQTYVYIQTWLPVLLGSLTFNLQPQTEFSTNIWG
jgi:hypothetical protein